MTNNCKRNGNEQAETSESENWTYGCQKHGDRRVSGCFSEQSWDRITSKFKLQINILNLHKS